MRSTLLAVASLVLLTSLPGSARADRSFAATGALSVKVEKVPQSTTQIARPTTAGTHPLVIASHGFSAKGENQLGWAKHFASWGFVVAVPTFASPFSPNHQANAKVISDLVADLGGAGVKVGLEGHSAGGLSTALAAVDVKPDAIVLFDPVDNSDLGKTASTTITAPVLGIFAAPGSCNLQAAWKSFVTTSKGPVLAFDVTGSTHCDGENAPRSLCAIGCGGGANATRQAAYAHYATAFLLAKLSGDAAATAALLEAEKDTELAGVVRTNSTTPVAPDASTSGSSSGTPTPSGSSSGSSATPGDEPTNGGEGQGTAATGEAAGEGGGCATPRESGGHGALLGIAFVAMGVLARRRRGHARG